MDLSLSVRIVGFCKSSYIYIFISCFVAYAGIAGNQTKSVGHTYIKLQDVYTYVCIFKFTDSDLAQHGVSERKRKQNFNVDAISGMWFNTYKP